MKRPHTAKPRKANMTAAGKPQKRYNNYMSGGKIGLMGAPVSSTPNNKRVMQGLGPGLHSSSIHSNIIVP